MKTTKRVAFLVLAFVLAAGATREAVAGSGGSAYSLIGLGDLRYVPGARAVGMGYAGLALASPQYIDGTSPASWYRINRTRFEGAAMYEGFNSTDGNSSRYLARMDFHGTLLAIPISQQDGIVFVGGFVPYSNTSYDTYTSGSFQQGTDTLAYRLHHIGTGGITKAQVGLSWAPRSDLALGASLNYMFGTLTDQMDQVNTNGTAAGGTQKGHQSSSGVSVTTGIIYSGFGAFGPAWQPLSLGLSLTTRASLHTTNLTTYEYVGGEHDSSTEKYGRVGIPFSLGIGLGYQLGERWAFAADYIMQPWSQADFQGSSPAGVRDSYRIGIGAERIGSKDMSAGWLDHISYRLGVTYNQTYYTINTQDIAEWGITAGLAFPLSGESRLNVAAEYGGRGTTSNNLIKDKIFRMTFSLNISDFWFIRYEEE
jgi:hypothetical protein